jgi:hypothetical protein
MGLNPERRHEMAERAQDLFIATFDDRGVITKIEPAPGRDHVEVKPKGPLRQNRVEMNSIEITEVMEFVPPKRRSKGAATLLKGEPSYTRCYQVHSGCQLWLV